jgi:hypothetical protein
MSEAGIDSLALVATELKWRSKKAPSYLEIQILPGPKLSPAYVDELGGELTPCVMCGVLGPPPPELPDHSARLAYAELENDPVLDAASLPAEWDLLRVQGCEGTIVASERFRNTVVELGLTNITFREVKVAVSEPVG